MTREVACTSNEPRLAAFSREGEAAFIAFAGTIALVLFAVRLGLNPDEKSTAVELALLMAILLPIADAAG